MTPIRFALLWFTTTYAVASAATLTVGKPGTPCPNPQYTTIGDAVSAAASGDVIQICPALYAEQLIIAKPLTLRGLNVQGVNRVLVQPASFSVISALSATAVITVMNTANVNIQNLAIDAGNNSLSGCATVIADVLYYNASGTVTNNALLGAQLSDPTSCPTLFPGNGFGVYAEKDANSSATFAITVQGNTISGFGRNGVLVTGIGEAADISENAITGIGPSTGANQFGVFLANGATGSVTNNIISQGTCGSISIPNCMPLRSEGVVLRSVGDGVVIDGNIITNVQSGVFLNGANRARVSNNVIKNVDAWDGIHVQGGTNTLIAGNRIFSVGPIGPYASSTEEGCGIEIVPGTGASNNTIRENMVSDAYCGVVYLTTDWLESNSYVNTLYDVLNGDNYPAGFPPFTEPGQTPVETTQAPPSTSIRQLR